MKNSSAFLLLTGLVAATACSKKDVAPTATTAVVLGILNASQEVPPTASKATGVCAGVYDKTTKLLTYTVTYSGLTPTVGHFHVGAPGVNGPVSLPFPFNNSTKTGFVSPITASATLTARQDSALLHHAFYANLHSEAYPGGEIRANLTAK